MVADAGFVLLALTFLGFSLWYARALDRLTRGG
jgi:hypothetical protein